VWLEIAFSDFSIFKDCPLRFIVCFEVRDALDINLTSKKCYSVPKQMNSITDKLAQELTTPL